MNEQAPPPGIHVAPSIAAARAAGRPVVALETAVLTHGLPRPDNLRVMHDVAGAVRARNAIPAVVGMMDGRLQVGLEDHAIERLARDESARKCSLRDLPIAAAQGAAGGTTVSATLVAAHAASIPVFATGGIGGVHRGRPSDVSADLAALARYPVIVVCSGPKTLLDLPATREGLETRGIPVLGWRCDRMPAFYVRDSGLPVDARVDTARDVLDIAYAHSALGLPAAIIVAVPVPREHAVPTGLVEDALDRAHAEAQQRALGGAAVTPFVLRRLAELTQGRSLEANRALLVQNASVAAQIAAEQARTG